MKHADGGQTQDFQYAFILTTFLSHEMQLFYRHHLAASTSFAHKKIIFEVRLLLVSFYHLTSLERQHRPHLTYFNRLSKGNVTDKM
jgi:hypothetical protein